MAKANNKKVSPIGRRLRALRKEHDWTLAEVGKRTGISVATLSKLENGQTELNFTSVNKLAEGLRLPVTDLTNPQPTATGRRTITLGGNGVVFPTADADFEVLCSDVADHQQGYLKALIKSRGIPQGMDWHRHDGQEFIYVLKGQLELHTELYDPVLLKAGDSILFDSSMGHHYVSRGKTDAQLLISFSLKGFQNVSDAFAPPRQRGKQRNAT